jgi:hypothetical protein
VPLPLLVITPVEPIDRVSVIPDCDEPSLKLQLIVASLEELTDTSQALQPPPDSTLFVYHVPVRSLDEYDEPILVPMVIAADPSPESLFVVTNSVLPESMPPYMTLSA